MRPEPLLSASLIEKLSVASTVWRPAESLVIRNPARSLSMTVTWAPVDAGSDRVAPLDTVASGANADREALTVVAVVERVTSVLTRRLVPLENCNASPALRLRVRDESLSLSRNPIVPLSWLNAESGIT